MTYAKRHLEQAMFHLQMARDGFTDVNPVAFTALGRMIEEGNAQLRLLDKSAVRANTMLDKLLSTQRHLRART